MRFAVVVGVLLLGVSGHAFSQDFDGRSGYIFNQAFATRITESDASALLQVKDSGEKFWNLYDGKGKATALPKGVKKSSDKLIFEAKGRPDLSLRSYVYRGKNDSGDSQRFSYVSELEKYHLVVVEFDHDRQCFILVDKGMLKVYFVDYAR